VTKQEQQCHAEPACAELVSVAKHELAYAELVSVAKHELAVAILAISVWHFSLLVHQDLFNNLYSYFRTGHSYP
jgi:hypothetical protein